MIRRSVDIIIPVYKGYEVTRACIESVLASENTIETHIYVINDASPEPELNAYLAGLSDNAPVTVLHNTSNLGFPRTVNKGFALNPDHDVILLNSDTLVFSDWADRMARAAYSSHDIGTVTPFSNNATICSYPFINQDNTLQTDISYDLLDCIFKQVNVCEVCDLPTGIGFCMYFTRECLEDVGDFDEVAFGRGYGEENDFCLRAHAQGWRNVLAADVYVPHIGGCSFSGSRDHLLEKNLAVLCRCYENYERDIERFVSEDILLPFRRAVDEQIIATKAGTPLMVRICHGFGGGTAKRLREEANELIEQGYRVATLRPAKGTDKGWANLTFEDAPDCPNLSYRLPWELDGILDLMRRQHVWEILMHHFLELDSSVLDIPSMLGVPHKVIVHDYGWYCPRINLINHTNNYCEETNIEQCQRCVDFTERDSLTPLNMIELINQSSKVLEKAEKIITPCNDTANHIKKYFNNCNTTTKPHEYNITCKSTDARTSQTTSNLVNVTIIGAIGKNKGYETVELCALDAAQRGLPIRYVIIGHTPNDFKLLKTGHVYITGEYQENSLQAILKKTSTDIFLFVSCWPETWCYALTEPLKSGKSIICSHIGSFIDRANTKTILINKKCNYKDINNLILDLQKQNKAFSKFSHDESFI